MKKLVLSLAIVFGGLSVQLVIASTPTFSQMAMKQHLVDSLRFSDIIHELYKGQTSEPYVDDESISALPHTKLGVDEEGYQVIGAMHPVVTYENTNGERRYLVVIEKVTVSADDGKLMDCRVCTGKADLFVFKRLCNGQYELVSQSDDDEHFMGSWGRINFDAEAIKDNIQPIGRDVVGGMFETGFTAAGVVQSSWNVLHLNEDDYIKAHRLIVASEDNSGYHEEGSPLIYSYTSTYQVLPDGSKYYPVKITYQGTKPNWYHNSKVEPTHESVVVQFDTDDNRYK